MTILGIETSCDETAIAVLDIADDQTITVRSNIISSQVHLHAEFGGVVPSLAAREHAKNINRVLEAALKEAGVLDIEKEVDLIAVTYGPGLGPALIVGIAFAKSLAMLHDKPLVGVDHMRGHIYSNWLNKSFDRKSVKFPILNLLVSGGHTELILMTDYEEFKLIGETQDDAVGEAFDKVARLLGLGYPGGPLISKLAEQGNLERFPLPSPMINSKNFDFSYSGLKTAALYLLRDLKATNIELDDQIKADIAASFQHAALEVLIQKTIRAAQEYNAQAIFLSGGVSANSLLRKKLHAAATELGIPYSQPDLAYTGDNAAMIALAGYFAYQKNSATAQWQTLDMKPNLGFN
ncbi:MAG: tRNA (adenosine(37)-N6)-threonylcarbamoyltransferase complex transferase subunit TsaD [Candidatus Yanofskybacteria bacterium RIFCSPHIGHO2_02_FULL_50_12]|uniref:tRNA N6-adenosine threonylcarbamoyltransferase n=1 Tax=Candidatus Yanofskybacteria bacterium RIFCSPHIGHO2_02_FULL_50_12 TaxID=1802685 RepID=A0A1F8FXB8_9BACT|nr:MAG: tRNA (adenosine(37)-N6)-threonylcarbamoyltransferase complex transferase subunit TsaD [Candidatus Yanofskybacteria bacterium RIFCSPHIGHO2_02_FULL_50_12]